MKQGCEECPLQRLCANRFDLLEAYWQDANDGLQVFAVPTTPENLYSQLELLSELAVYYSEVAERYAEGCPGPVKQNVVFRMLGSKAMRCSSPGGQTKYKSLRKAGLEGVSIDYAAAEALRAGIKDG